jgi:hypothetical protein
MAGIVNDLLIHGQHLASPFLVTLDLLGTFVFALSGAAARIPDSSALFYLQRAFLQSVRVREWGHNGLGYDGHTHMFMPR